MCHKSKLARCWRATAASQAASEVCSRSAGADGDSSEAGCGSCQRRVRSSCKATMASAETNLHAPAAELPGSVYGRTKFREPPTAAPGPETGARAGLTLHHRPNRLTGGSSHGVHENSVDRPHLHCSMFLPTYVLFTGFGAGA